MPFLGVDRAGAPVARERAPSPRRRDAHGAAGKEHTNAPHGAGDHSSAQAHYMKMAKLHPEKAAYYHGLAGSHAARGTKK